MSMLILSKITFSSTWEGWLVSWRYFALAAWAKVGRTGSEGNPADWGAASWARLVGAAVGGKGLLEEPAFTIDVDVQIIE